MRQLKITQKLTNIDNDSFKLYLREVSDIQVFTPEEELECAKKAASGDRKAIDELVLRNLRFVISVAKQYTTEELPLEDLVNEGNIGLIMASQRFKPDMGYKFISFAVWWIRKLILEHINTHGKMVRLPSNQINNINKLEKKIGELEQKNGRSIDISEALTELLDETEPKTKKGKRLKENDEDDNDQFRIANIYSRYDMDSLDRPMSSDGDGIVCFGDLLYDKSENKTDHLVDKPDTKSTIDGMLEVLSPRDKQIMVLLFGLNGDKPMTLQEVGDEVGLTREMIRQIKIKSLSRLKNSPRVKMNINNLM